METGWRRGEGMGMRAFVSEDGYTSVAVAVSLLVSLSLVFCVATVEWTLARSADLQRVADATALAGENVVAAYTSLAQVLDACVLSMGLLGATVLGAGLIMAAVPGAQVASSGVLDAGRRLLEARQRFAVSVSEGLQRLEGLLPYLCVANSYACARANDEEGMGVTGFALPYPLTSRSDFSSLGSGADPDEVVRQAQRLQEATKRAEEAKARADEALRRAWEADCVDGPSCLRSRAASLAGLAAAQNPTSPSPDAWSFAMPILRSRAYYARRIEREQPKADDIESVTDSRARAAYYAYALSEVRGAWCRELGDGTVDLHVPHLAHNVEEVRATSLYTDPAWPCTMEGDRRTLHSTMACEGARGDACGVDAVSSIDAGTVALCPVCQMDVRDLGAVASISTVATNGYERYWRIIADAAPEYASARRDRAEAERAGREVADDGRDALGRLLEQLRVPRPRICPPGAWGCVGVAVRDGGKALPNELTSSFVSGTSLPAGVAVSAAVLAPDEGADAGNVLSRFFDGATEGAGPTAGGLLGGVTDLWGSILVSYGSAYEGTGSAIGGFLDGIDGVFGGTTGSWLKGKVASLLETAGLQPADMRLRKPVLVSPHEVLAQAGVDSDATLLSLVQALPSKGSAAEIARAAGIWVWDEWTSGEVSVAELPVPGTGVSVPITVDLDALGGAA